MGLLLSVVLSYAGILEAMECINHIMAGMVPDTEPDFRDLVDYYTSLLHKASNPTSNVPNWIAEGGQGYLCLTEDKDGKLQSAAVKYYDGSKPDSAAILFSTKISSFGQDSVESKKSHANGDYNNSTERYPTNNTTTTKTLIANTSESFSIGQRNRSITPSVENVSDPTHFSENSFEPNQDFIEHEKHSTKPQTEHRDEPNDDNYDRSESKEKLTWHYRPLSPAPATLPEIHFHSSDGTDIKGDPAYSEDFLRSLDGIKYRPLQRSDPSGRRRSFKKRHSSSSTSSRESRASREEELKMFTSLEEAEFEPANKCETDRVHGSSPNLAAHSISRSRSRENSKEKNETWSMEASMESVDAEQTELKPRLKDLPKLGSFEEEKVEDAAEQNQVTADAEEVDDFWGNSGD